MDGSPPTELALGVEEPQDALILRRDEDMKGNIGRRALLVRRLSVIAILLAAYAYHRTIADFIGLPDEQMLYCGMAIGYADLQDPVNQWRTERAPLEDIARFLVDG